MALKEVKAALLKKGWAGRTLSRRETVERLNPLIRRLVALGRAYGALGTEIGAELSAELKTAVLDIGKLTETVHSCGGVAYVGVDMDADEWALGADVAVAKVELKGREGVFADEVRREGAVEHRIRTRAILSRIQTNSERRLVLLRGMTKSRRP